MCLSWHAPAAVDAFQPAPTTQMICLIMIVRICLQIISVIIVIFIIRSSSSSRSTIIIIIIIIMCKYVYIYIYICAYIHIHIHMYMYTHMHIHTHTYIYIYTYIHTYIYIYTHTRLFISFSVRPTEVKADLRHRPFWKAMAYCCQDSGGKVKQQNIALLRMMMIITEWFRKRMLRTKSTY